MKTNVFFSLIFFAFVSVFFIACKSATQDSRSVQLLADSASLNNNTLSDTSRSDPMKNASDNPGHILNSAQNKNSGLTPAGSDHNAKVSKGESNSESTGTVPASGEGNQKKGWSKAAQGAVIGGAAGAVGGAIISKKKGVGAAVGAAVGATGGYIIGREKDKKDGRVSKEKN